MNKIVKVLLSSVFCLSTLAGCTSSPYAKAEAQTLTIQGVPVYVEPDEDTTQNDVDTALKYLKKQPVSIPLSEVHVIRYRSPHNPLKKSIFFKS